MDPLTALLSRSRPGTSSRLDESADPALSLGAVLAVTLALALIATHVSNAILLDGAVRQFNADEERTVFSWASSSATFAAALVATLLALWLPTLRLRFSVLAAILLFFSLDDAVGVHEALSVFSTDDLGLPLAAQRLLWPVVYMPLAAVVIVTLLSTVGSGRPRKYLVIGIGLLLLAIVAELASVVWSGLFFEAETLDIVEVALEESAELAGWILIAASLAAALRRALAGALAPEGELSPKLAPGDVEESARSAAPLDRSPV